MNYNRADRQTELHKASTGLPRREWSGEGLR